MNNLQNNPATSFSLACKEIIKYSREEALRLGNDYISSEHFILGILKQGGNIALNILTDSLVQLDMLKVKLKGRLKKNSPKISDLSSLPLTKQAEKVIRVSVLEANKYNSGFIDSACLLLAILNVKDSIACKALEQQSIKYLDITNIYQKVSKSENKSSSSTFAENVTDTHTEEESQVQYLLERIIQVSMRDTIEGVLDVETESAEIASLLMGLSLDQGMMFGLFGQWGRGKTFF